MVWLSEKMKRYIISNDDKYIVNRGGLLVNREIAVPKTTREGTNRADASDYIAPDLPKNTNIGEMKLEDIRIRKLTPKECWRLMGFAELKESGESLKFDDTPFDKASKVCSNSQLYKQAGNSIVVNVLEDIFKQML